MTINLKTPAEIEKLTGELGVIVESVAKVTDSCRYESACTAEFSVMSRSAWSAAAG